MNLAFFQTTNTGAAAHININAPAVEGSQLTPAPSPALRRNTPSLRPRYLERSYGPSPSAIPPHAVHMLKTPRLPPGVQAESASTFRPAAAERDGAAHRAATPSPTPIARPPVFFPLPAAPLRGQSRPQAAVAGPSNSLADRRPVFTLPTKPDVAAVGPPRAQGLAAAPNSNPAGAAGGAANALAPFPQPSQRDSDPAAEDVLMQAVTAMGEQAERAFGYHQRSQALCEQANHQLYAVVDFRKQIFQEKAARMRMLAYALRWQGWSAEALDGHLGEMLAEDGGPAAALQGEIEAIRAVMAEVDAESMSAAGKTARALRAEKRQNAPVVDPRIRREIADVVKSPSGWQRNASSRKRRWSGEASEEGDEPKGSKRARSSPPRAEPSPSDAASPRNLSKGKGKAREVSPVREEPEEAMVVEEQECATVPGMAGSMLSGSEAGEGPRGEEQAERERAEEHAEEERGEDVHAEEEHPEDDDQDDGSLPDLVSPSQTRWYRDDDDDEEEELVDSDDLPDLVTPERLFAYRQEEDEEKHGEEDDTLPALAGPAQDALPQRSSPPVERPVSPVPRRSPSVEPAQEPEATPARRKSTRRKRKGGR
ncbi:hypothetical protein IEO21_02031 [Rhodonia placenta]|uniref:Uncharacterized protein n=1 Tax=Rhodonia placenta TaxID=104341 RepID=A0A8H7P8H4_9APHY|nr:hypothetical protein IEO21_02031 [Postia placenta]